jgi:hypothetical protein
MDTDSLPKRSVRWTVRAGYPKVPVADVLRFGGCLLGIHGKWRSASAELTRTATFDIDAMPSVEEPRCR